jgi:DNA polymerase-3 subunit delta
MLPFPAFKRDKVLSKDKEPLRVYGTLGDAELQRRVVASLLDWSMDADARDFNLDVMDGESSSISDVMSRGGNLPFLSERRVVHVLRAERLEGMHRGGDSDDKPVKPKGKAAKSAGASPAKRLVEGLQNLPPTTVVILSRTPETPEVGARAATARCINANVDKAIDVANFGLLIDCTIGAKNASMATAVLESEAVARGIPLSREAAAHLTARAGNDIARNLNELEKCALRAGIGNTVTPAVIDDMVQRAPSETIFDLTDALGERKTARAITLLRELLGEGQAPELVLSMLVRHLRQLLQARALLDARLPLDGSAANRIGRDLSVQFPKDGRDNLLNLLQSQNWLGRRLGQQARNFSTPQLQSALQNALEVDLALKGIEGDGGTPDLLLELLLAKMN